MEFASWWGMMQLFHRPQPRVTVAQLLSWAEAQVARGVPRQAICQEWLQQHRCAGTPDLKSIYEQAERQLFGEMVARDLRGSELEKMRRTDEAIAEYEAIVADGFLGAHPYERLQALYLARGDYDSALRVSQARVRTLSLIRPPTPPSWDETPPLRLVAING
ncbi:hypothetical protein [Armatimonas rosea]|uniref:Tetratricopeptide (TPR) repeat protein n=1 Tax=Armatimonas rosea TaxID=685828 RepID=A0A7W9SQD5_ARMRO|nr:hypothetical protein [Armatimonas rosea]MBB6050900.1 tetratricopeptide (TPR) repeat protein [Armatimonas rosea]